MSENETVQTVDGGEENGFQPITSQADLDRLIGERLSRERAKFADYDDLKAAAEKLGQIEESNKSEIQKALERAEAAEKRAEEAAAAEAAAGLKAVRAEIAAAKGVPASLLSGSTVEELEVAAEELVKWRDTNAPASKPGPLRSGAGRPDNAVSARELAVLKLRAT